MNKLHYAGGKMKDILIELRFLRTLRAEYENF